ncbi:MAG: hypothetical protein FWF97_01425 [Alphaproteobacteria bacterium]|nr:hypothetical protein [Alphaproteobacteria bacterium]
MGFNFKKADNISANAKMELQMNSELICCRCAEYCENGGRCDPIAEEPCGADTMMRLKAKDFAEGKSLFINQLAHSIERQGLFDCPSSVMSFQAYKEALEKLAGQALDVERVKKGLILIPEHIIYEGKYAATVSFEGNKISVMLNANARNGKGEQLSFKDTFGRQFDNMESMRVQRYRTTGKLQLEYHK